MSIEAVETASRVGAGRRERRKAETRARLVAAARALFAARGYEATRPQDVARAADVAIGTFYLHFADRRDVFRAVSAETAAELMQRARRRAQAAPGGFEARLRAYLDELLDFSAEQPGVIRVLFADGEVIAAGEGSSGAGASLRELLAGGLSRSLRAAIESGELDPDVDPALIAHGLVGFIEGALAYARRSPHAPHMPHVPHAPEARPGREPVLDQIAGFVGRALARTRPDPTGDPR